MNDFSGPVAAADYGSYQEFMELYEGSEIQQNIGTFITGFAPLLWRSVVNKDIDARIAISNQLIDDGVNVAYEDNETNVLHVYFNNRTFEPEKEAPLLRRLLKGGADLNLQPSKGYSPLITFISNPRLRESQRAPFYDVLLEFPEFVYREPDGSLRWPHRATLTACIEAHEAKAGGR
ncbi:hypothetical protein TPB0596_44680 [Tsukamurella pulmonis]|uniref:hypothetical protein n=1 Tax=Tsukamurella pulmonis TaxID=47312 RepID=UPI001EE015A6|nr:hypothetical protein [Tsukamurella pulmonis]BDD84705.1 hypothetical protein TPB0596_44680 [Tsukamurella pulmonis]